MTTTDDSSDTRARSRFDRPVTVSGLVAGAACLLAGSVPFGEPALSWPLLLVGAAYVVGASLFLGRVYAAEVLTRSQEASAWAAPWLVAVALWTGIGASVEGSVAGFSLVVGLVVATPCYLVWQILALAVRQAMAWRGGQVVEPRGR